MAIIFFALAFILTIVVLFLSFSGKHRNQRNEGWERKSASEI